METSSAIGNDPEEPVDEAAFIGRQTGSIL
jgi:hypothetical protein